MGLPWDVDLPLFWLLLAGLLSSALPTHMSPTHAAQCRHLKRQIQSLRDWGDPSTALGSFYSKVAHYPGVMFPFSPDYSCADEMLLGDRIDGGKWVCGAGRLPRHSCVVYSFGSNGDFSFETELLAVAPQCEVHTFDPGNFSGTVPKGLRVFYHNWALGPTDRPPVFSLPTVMRTLRHNHVDVLKVDIESAELSIFPELFSNPLRHAGVGPVGIFLLEHHGARVINDTMEIFNVPAMRNHTLRLRTEMLAAGFLLYHVEPNPQCLQCVELAWVNFTTLPAPLRPPCRIDLRH